MFFLSIFRRLCARSGLATSSRRFERRWTLPRECSRGRCTRPRGQSARGNDDWATNISRMTFRAEDTRRCTNRKPAQFLAHPLRARHTENRRRVARGSPRLARFNSFRNQPTQPRIFTNVLPGERNIGARLRIWYRERKERGQKSSGCVVAEIEPIRVVVPSRGLVFLSTWNTFGVQSFKS